MGQPSWTPALRPALASPATSVVRDLAGATPDQFRDWLAKLPDGFRLALLNSRDETGQPLLNAVAVHERKPQPVRFFPELNQEVDRQTYQRMRNGKDHFRPLLVCSYGRHGEPVTSQLWSLRKDFNSELWTGDLSFVQKKIENEANLERRPIFLHGPAPTGWRRLAPRPPLGP